MVGKNKRLGELGLFHVVNVLQNLELKKVVTNAFRALRFIKMSKDVPRNVVQLVFFSGGRL